MQSPGLMAFMVGGGTMESAVLIGLILSVFWVYQFVQLMLFSDGDFPGRYDKPLWAAAFVFAFLLAPLAFFGWKQAYKAMISAKAGPKEPHS